MDRIDYIEFPSSNRAITSAFFQAAFGWGVVSYGPDYDGVTGAGIDGGVDQAQGDIAAPVMVHTGFGDDFAGRVIGAHAVVHRTVR